MYSRIPDELATDSRHDAAGLAATGLWTLCDSWSGGPSALTNGFIPKGIAERYAKGKRALIRALIDNGIWTEAVGTVEHGPENVGRPGYLSVDYRRRNDIDHIEVRAKLASTSGKRRVAGAKGGATAAENRRAMEQQIAQQKTDFATPLAAAKPPGLVQQTEQQTSSPAAPPETRDQRPPGDTVPVSSSQYASPWHPAAAAQIDAPPSTFEQVIDLAVRCKWSRAQGTIRDDLAWQRRVAGEIAKEHGDNWRHTIDAGTTDVRQIVADTLGLTRELVTEIDVRTRRKGTAA